MKAKKQIITQELTDEMTLWKLIDKFSN